MKPVIGLRPRWGLSSAASSGFVSARERQLFVEEFEKDLKFIQLFFLLINKSGPIKKIDLVWAEDGPAGRVGLRRLMGTADALDGPCAALLSASGDAGKSEPSFCGLINDFGRREAESCGISDRAAEQRVRKTRRAEVYRCHAGLVDIAVPVFCDGQHVATLLTGQVLRNAPTQSDFVQIAKDVSRLGYVSLPELRKAYFQVPVVSDEEIRNTTQVLEVFAEYLGNSWKRLTELVREQNRKSLESQLYRKEFAHLLLEGDAGDRSSARELMRKLGFSRSPNRVLVVRLESEDEYYTPKASFDLAFTSALQAIDHACERLKNVTAAYLRRRGVCVFFHDGGARGGYSGHFSAHELANKVLLAIASRTDIRARVGVGQPKQEWNLLVDSYHEASMALVASADTIAVYQKPSASVQELNTITEALCRALAEKRFEEVRELISSLPLAAARRLGDQDLEAQRHFFAAVLDSLSSAANKSGAESARVAELRGESHARLAAGAGAFELQESFLQVAEEIVAEVRRLYCGRREKIVDLACRIVERELDKPVPSHRIALPAIASALGVSAGHLSRTFRQLSGVTFERHVMMKRVELAMRLLLEPTATVSAVSERCGFSDPTYFARVFKRISGRSPSRYLKNPVGHAAR